MRLKLFIVLALISGIFLSFNWSKGGSSRSASSQVELLKKKKKKPKKKKKKKKTKKKNAVKKAPVDSAKLAKQKKRKEKKVDRNLAKLQKKKEKKAKIVKKAQEDRKTYDKCDSADVVRTSQDTLLLAKYMKVYRTLGGICYIIHLQKIADLENTSDGFYYVQIKPSKDPRAPAAWQTYLYCPIGKPNGMVALLNPEGDTIQVCSYLNEKKNGLMSYFQKGKGLIYQERFVDDIKVWEKKPEDD